MGQGYQVPLLEGRDESRRRLLGEDVPAMSAAQTASHPEVSKYGTAPGQRTLEANGC